MEKVFRISNLIIKNRLNNFIKPKISLKFFCTDKNTTSNENFEEKIQAPPRFKTNLSEDMETAKKQIFWRIRNLGQLELEFIVFKWYDANNKDLGIKELKAFSEEVLEMENPDLNRYLVSMQPADSSLVYTNKIQNYVR